MLKVWDGGRESDKYAAPNAKDWANIVQEVIGIQRVIIENNSIFSNTANEDILIGQPLILRSNGHIKLANIETDPEVIGLSIVNCSAGENCIYISQGRLSLTDWSNITNSITLIPGDCYYLIEKGKLISTVPSSLVVIEVGRAQNKTTFSVDIKIPIYLE